MRIGFAGLGLMGCPMAVNLLRAGTPLIVYNRSPEPAERLRAEGARVAASPSLLFERSDLVLLMLANDGATDAVLDRGGPAFRTRVSGKLIVNMGTHSPAYSQALEAEIRAKGGAFVEAPVSGSRRPAEAAQLIAMVAGDPEVTRQVRPILAAMCRSVVTVGPVPSAMAMKLAVNLYLLGTVAALAEAAALASRLGVDLTLFRTIIEAGPMRSDVAIAKLEKMIGRTFEPEATLRDVCKNGELIAASAAAVGAAAPMLNQCLRLFHDAAKAGAAELDMAAIVKAFASPHWRDDDAAD